VLNGSEGGTGYPRVEVMVNNRIYFNDIVEGQKDIRFTVEQLSIRNILSIEMTNKSSKDTLLHGDNIVKDKKLVIEKIVLDDVDIRNYIYRGRQKPIYHQKNQGPKFNVGDHLFFNGQWKLYYENPSRLFLASFHGKGQKINLPEKQETKNRYMQQVVESINLNNDKKYY